MLPLAAPWLRDLRAGPVSINRTVDYIGEIPQAMPSFDFPQVANSTMLQVLLSAAIALLGSLDSLLTSLVDGQHQGHPAPEQQKKLIGQGIGNIAAGLFGGLSGAGATVRSVVNVRNGGQTALSAATHQCRFVRFRCRAWCRGAVHPARRAVGDTDIGCRRHVRLARHAQSACVTQGRRHRHVHDDDHHRRRRPHHRGDGRNRPLAAGP
ncbi:SulP family inorganic anion transporter [Mycolicibacterium novocastrense]|nr:SulP family inorganic anion transporter [Mycolicibacterium novocastrense]